MYYCSFAFSANRVDTGDQLHDQLERLAEEIDEEIRRSGPTYSPARIEELRTEILAAAQPAVREAFHRVHTTGRSLSG